MLGAPACRSDVGAIMAENRSKLAERGEKLENLQERTSMLESDAQDFAAMAKRLAAQERNKKWWQL